MTQAAENTVKTPVARGFLAGIVGVVAVLILAWGAYKWFFCRVYVPTGMMAVVTAKTGKDPKPGSILVERGEKGIWREVLSEGRYFFDPVLYDVKLAKNITIPLGKVGVVTSKIGRELPPGEILAADDSSKGVRRNVLGPGVYRLNPEGYKVEILDAIIQRFGKVPKNEIVDTMHKEDAYTETAPHDVIQFKYAKTLSLA